MQANSSSDVSLLSRRICFSNSSLYPHFLTCYESTSGFINITAFTFSTFLPLPLYVLVLWIGFRQWRHQCSAGSANHSDIFIYHMVTVEMISIWGNFFTLSGLYMCNPRVLVAGYYFIFLTYPGQTLFHCLTCVERYLAVVHPITYLALKKGSGVKFRNISSGCVWLLSFGLMGLTALYFPDYPNILFFSLLAITVTIIYFCSLSVLCVLWRLGLGKVGGHKGQVDQSKMRALYTILAILGALKFRMGGLLIINIIFDYKAAVGRNECVALLTGMWLCLPSSLVLPLLFVYRAGILACSCRNLNLS